MPPGGPRQTIATWSFIVAALSVTIAVAVFLFRAIPAKLEPVTAPAGAGAAGPAPQRPGVTAVLTAGAVTAERTLPAMAFALTDGQSLDPRLPAGAFDGTFTVAFEPGAVRRAAIGAEISGGELVIERRGRVVGRGSAGAAAATVRSDPVYLPGDLVTFTYRFRHGGDGPARLRALWWPEDGPFGLDLPAHGAAAEARPAEAGYALARQLNCTACHAADGTIDPGGSPAPRLGAVGSRVRPGWARRWLAAPQALKAGAAMPRLFEPGEAEALEDVVHFLASLGGPLQAAVEEPDADLDATGRVLYRQVGCAACHGPLEAPAGDAAFVSLGPLSAKTAVEPLAAFLADPVAVRPSGRMPSQDLTDVEATALATYLIERDRRQRGTVEPETLKPDPQRVARGRDEFAARGCAACHELTPEGPAIESALAAPGLASVRAGRGCLAAAPPAGVPEFGLSDRQRAALDAFVTQQHAWTSSDVPHLRLAAALQRLNCLACHGWHGAGGVREPVDRYFTTVQETDLGDEGRLPPELSFAGARLQPGWLRSVLEDAGVARPYMAARMPQFGADNVEALPALFAAAGGVPGGPAPGREPPAEPGAAEIGRRLVGEHGFNCIQCHAIAGRPATGLPGPDLVQMTERLRYGHFAGWVHDPRVVRPGTRMPTFFSGGRSGLPWLDGDAERQIAAIWAYLFQGEHLPLPEGLPAAAEFELDASAGPIVFRTFMKGVGARAIACGFPENVHFAFDAERCRLALAWSGRFLSAAGAWAARGGSETDPPGGAAWTAPDRPLFAAPGGAALPARFRGYRLDDARRPIFLYSLEAPAGPIEVSEQPLPRAGGEGPGLLRRFELSGPPGTAVAVDGLPVQRLDADGRAGFVKEVSW